MNVYFRKRKKMKVYFRKRKKGSDYLKQQKQSSVAADNQPLLPTSDLCTLKLNEPDTSASSSQQLEWLTMITWNVNAKCSKSDDQNTSAQKKRSSKHNEESDEEQHTFAQKKKRPKHSEKKKKRKHNEESEEESDEEQHTFAQKKKRPKHSEKKKKRKHNEESEEESDEEQHTFAQKKKRFKHSEKKKKRSGKHNEESEEESDKEQHTSAQKKKRSKHSEEREKERKNKNLAIRRVLLQFSPHIIILQETSDTQAWENTSFEFMTLSKGAGIVLLWNTQYLKCIDRAMQSGSKEDLCLSATFCLVTNPSFKFKFYGVYGDSINGFQFYGDNLDLEECTDPWILMGDINLTSDLERGRSYLSYRRQALKKYWHCFKEFLKLPHVVEMEFKTDKFTHRDFQEVERLSRLDSVICSRKFIELFKGYEVDTHATSLSDHKPVIALWKFESK